MEESGKILIEVCMGTTCFVMGSARLQEIEKLIPPQYKKLVTVKTHTCLDLCHSSTYMRAPFVKIDGEIISQATVEKIIQAIERKINEQ